jgi:acyl-CoA thioesterase FadM
MTVRFRHSAPIGHPLTCTARVESSRRRLIETTGEVRTADGTLVCTATGKYVPVDDARDAAFKETLVDEPKTHPAAAMLTRGIPMDKDD